MSLLDTMRSVALDLLDSTVGGYGEEITLTKITNGAYDTTTSALTTSTSTAITGYGHAIDYDARFIDGETIQAGDKQVLVHNLSQEPAVGDTLTINSLVYTIVEVKNIRVLGGNAAFKMQVRSAN